MKHLTFGAFLVDDTNRDAFRMCKAVADLQQVSPQPVLLLGDEGCGKTHLLYAIVNYVRSRTVKAGLAYVTAHDFPSQVRALIEDPSPVMRVRSGILLVDRLEQFTNLVEELEAVVRIFLDHGHYVVLASSVHPGRLQNLTPGLRTILEAGQIVRVEPSPGETQIELLKRKIRQELEEQLAAQRREIEGLRSQLEQPRPDTLPGRPDEAGQYALAALREEKEAALAEAAQARMLLQAERSEKEDLAHRLDEVRVQLDAARQESAQARSEANQLLQRAERLLVQIEMNRVRLAQSEAHELREIEPSPAAEQAAAAARAAEAEQQAGEAKRLLASLRDDFEVQRLHYADLKESAEALERSRSELGAERDRLAALLEQARAEEDRLQEALDEARSDGDALQTRLDALQKSYEMQNQEMESLRHEAAAQVAEAQAQAGEIEGRLNRFRAAYRDTRQTNRNVAGALEVLDGQLAATAETLAQLAERLKASESDLDEERGPLETPAPDPVRDEAPHVPVKKDDEPIPAEPNDVQLSATDSSLAAAGIAERDVSI